MSWSPESERNGTAVVGDSKRRAVEDPIITTCAPLSSLSPLALLPPCCNYWRLLLGREGTGGERLDGFNAQSRRRRSAHVFCCWLAFAVASAFMPPMQAGD